MKYTKFNEKNNPCNCLSYTDFIYSFIACLSNLLNLLEMQTVIKQAICVNVLQMCCKTRANERKENLLSFPSAAEFDLGQIWK